MKPQAMMFAEAPLRAGEVVESLHVPDVSCPRCGGPLEYVNDRPPGVTGYSTMVLLGCRHRGCPTWELRIEFITTGAPPTLPKPITTNKGT